MSSRNTARFLGGLGLPVALTLLVACAKDDPAPSEPYCVQHGPAFRVQLSAADGPVPSDTKIEVSYQGDLVESFDVGRPSSNEDICCRLANPAPSPLPATQCGSTDGGGLGGDAARATVVLCDVWSNGAATVNVTAHGYEPVTAELMARADEECKTIVTSEVTLLLERGDAGLEEQPFHRRSKRR